jgi:hypothetical protein
VGLARFLRTSPISRIISTPFVYALILPLALLDLCVNLYQAICFPLWGIARVPRSDFIVVDRHHLPYLNGIQKLNCIYCGYANGLIALTREIAGRTEQYWCPIKHASRVAAPHHRYRGFVDYGDATGYRDKIKTFREKLGKS